MEKILVCLLCEMRIIDMSSDTWCVATDLTNVFIPIKKENFQKLQLLGTDSSILLWSCPRAMLTLLPPFIIYLQEI